VDVLLPCEQVIWSGRPVAASRLHPGCRRVRYLLTDLRLVVSESNATSELVLRDIGEVELCRSAIDRAAGSWTVVVRARDARIRPLVLRGLRRGRQLAPLLEILSRDRRPALSPDAVRAALDWTPRVDADDRPGALTVLAALLLVTFAGAAFLRHRPAPIAYAPDDAIAPGGVKRGQEAIAGMMRREVMPWARAALAPLVGGADRVTCATCHGKDADSRGWRMPGVAALPEPAVAFRGWERYSSGMDAQMRNAIYGYAAEPDKQPRATYMRHVIMPGMAKLLRRPAYDFTRSYDYNRSHNALGCYHCHRVR
jgi:cytochrome c553